MTRDPIWKTIAETLAAEIAQGLYAPGVKLPTEAELARRFGVNRHTVRRALADLAERGLVLSRRGAGVFVQAAPTEYPLGRRVRFHQAVSASGRTPDRRRLRLETRPASAPEAEALGLEAGAPVVVYEGISLSDGQPLALFESVFPAERLPGLPEALEEESSVTRALAACGVEDYLRAETRLSAHLADAVQARHLQLKPGAPLLRSVALNTDPAGRPVERGTTWFAGERISLVVAPDTE
jgi:GntR family phosphonate transport system transcriptional regulator